MAQITEVNDGFTENYGKVEINTNDIKNTQVKSVINTSKLSDSDDDLLQEIANSLTDKDLSHLINSSDKKSSDNKSSEITSNTRKKKKTLNL